MEILLGEPVDLELVADLLQAGIKRQSPATPRDNSIWHVTNLLRSGQLIAKGDTRYWEGDGAPSGIMSWGRIWESAVDCYLQDYATKHNGFYQSDVENIKDDVIASLDGIMFLSNLGWMVCETKLRFTLNNEILLDHLQQVRAYCHLANTDLVCYVSGHISSTPPTARASMRIVKLTKQSIEECWQGILNTKTYLEKCGCFPQGRTKH